MQSELRRWLGELAADQLSHDLVRESVQLLARFPEACREALVRDISVIGEWRTWLSGARAASWSALLSQGDEHRARWTLAWLDTLLEATQQVAAQASWKERSYPPGLPRSVAAYWSQHYRELAEFPELFWRDLVDLLVGTRTKVLQRAASTFPVVPEGIAGTGRGLLVRWELEAVEGAKQGVFWDPSRVVVRAVRPDFMALLREAERAAGCSRPVRVRVVPVDPRDENYLCLGWLSGPSGGGALYVGLRALEKGLQPEPGLAVSFALRDGRPEPVGRVEVKARACARHDCSRLVVAEDYSLPQDLMLEVVRVDSLEQAEAEALGLAAAIKDYLHQLRDSLDRTPWRSPSGELIRLTQIAVEPRVLKKAAPRVPLTEKLEEGDQGPAQGRRHRSAGPSHDRDRGRDPVPERVPPVPREPRRYRDPEVARYYEEPTQVEGREEVPWSAEAASVTRAVILGAPGGGKTFLSRWTVLCLAERATAELSGGRNLAELPVPVHVELPALARRLEVSGPPEPSLRDYLMGSGIEARHADQVVSLLRSNSQAWLVLDALDQVPEEAWPALREWLGKVEGWKCRLVLTCRTARYDREFIPWAQLSEYELAPLSPDRVRNLLRNWLGDRRGGALWEQVLSNRSLLEACGSPLVASLVCWIWQEGRAPAGFRRGDIYDRALQRLVQRGWERLGKSGSPVELGHRLAVLREAAWQLFRGQPDSNDFGQSEVEGALRAAVQELNYSLSTDQLLREFLEAGILQEAGWEHGEARLSFLHRSFVEYLAGWALARKAEAAWDRWKPLVDRWAWDPAWWETIVFMGWAMRNPEPLLELLADRDRDDYFRHRLMLALRVLLERV